MSDPYYNLLNNLPRPDIQGALSQFGTSIAEGIMARRMMLAKQQAEAAERERMAQARAQLSSDISALRSNPSPQNLLTFSLTYPELSKQAEMGVSAISAEERENRAGALKEPYFALESGNIEAFKESAGLLEQAYRNAEDTQSADKMRRLIETAEKDPARARLVLGGEILALETPEKFKETASYLAGGRTAFEREESAAKKARADAEKAAVDARFAESDAIKSLDLKDAQIRAYATDENIKNQNLDIKRAELALRREAQADARAARQEQLDLLRQKRDQTVLDKAAQFSKNYGALEDTEKMVMSLLAIPEDTRSKVHGAFRRALIEGAPLTAAAVVPQESVDYEEKMGTMKSRMFLTAIEAMRGFGTLDANEGKRLETAQGSLNLRQSVKATDEALNDILKIIRRNKSAARAQFGVSAPLAEEGLRGQPAADAAEEPIFDVE